MVAVAAAVVVIVVVAYVAVVQLVVAVTPCVVDADVCRWGVLTVGLLLSFIKLIELY